MALERSESVHLLIRANHNRRVEHPSHYLQAAIAQAPVAGTTTVEVSAKVGRPPRQATLRVRYQPLPILPPRNRRGRTQLSAITVKVIWAHEEHPPEGTEPISWLLLTTLNVTSKKQACQCLCWYALRWLIERFHYVLKNGCRIEQLQLETGDMMVLQVSKPFGEECGACMIWLRPGDYCTLNHVPQGFQQLWVKHRTDGREDSKVARRAATGLENGSLYW